MTSIYFIIGLVICSTALETTEHRLATYLLNGYNAQVRPPSKNGTNEATKVGFAMTIIQVIDVNEKAEEMTTTSYIICAWNDTRFTWDPADYDGIEIFRIPADNIWTPRIILINSKDGEFDVAYQANTLISHDGAIEWLPPALYKSSCSINVQLFPFDWQNCSMIFRSATYGRDELDLEAMFDQLVVDFSVFQSNGEWDLVQSPVVVNTKEDDPDYVDITFYFILRRKPQFYVMNIIIPCLLMTMLSLFVFFLPSISCEKMTLSISILLGQTIFLFLIAQRMPATSLSVPLIGGYLLFSMILIIFCVMFSVLVCNIHFRSAATHTIPPWMTKVFMGFLAPKLKVQRPPQTSCWTTPSESLLRKNSQSTCRAMLERSAWKSPSEILFDHQAKRYGFRQRHVAENDYGLNEIHSSNNGNIKLNEVPASIRAVPKPLRPTVENVRFIAAYVKNESQIDQSADDWAYIALILDRLLFWIYLIVFVIGSALFFLQTTMEDYPENQNIR